MTNIYLWVMLSSSRSFLLRVVQPESIVPARMKAATPEVLRASTPGMDLLVHGLRKWIVAALMLGSVL